MVWLGTCSSKSLIALVILDKGTVDHGCYIKSELLVAFKYGNEVSGDKWIFQKDGANTHQHHLTKEWCQDNFPSFIDTRIDGLQRVQV